MQKGNIAAASIDPAQAVKDAKTDKEARGRLLDFFKLWLDYSADNWTHNELFEDGSVFWGCDYTQPDEKTLISENQIALFSRPIVLVDGKPKVQDDNPLLCAAKLHRVYELKEEKKTFSSPDEDAQEEGGVNV